MPRISAIEEIRVCRAIRLLAEGWDLPQVAQAIKVRHGTLAAWMADDDFQTLREALVEAVQMREIFDAQDRLIEEAIGTLRRTLREGNPALAVRVAQDILNRAQVLAPPAKRKSEVIRVEYKNTTADGKPLPWTKQNPPKTQKP
jgi:hypothetical protein